MPFRLRTETRRWFTDIRDVFPVDFDMYYLCLMAGLATRKKADVTGNEATDLVDYFPGDYRGRGSVIISLFLSRELQKMGISLAERHVLHQAIRRLIDPQSPSRLSDDGLREMNRYANAGFEVLTEWFEDRPRAIETFLPMYKRRLQAALAEE